MTPVVCGVCPQTKQETAKKNVRKRLIRYDTLNFETSVTDVGSSYWRNLTSNVFAGIGHDVQRCVSRVRSGVNVILEFCDRP